MSRPKGRKYVPMYNQVLPAQKEYAEAYADKHGIAINQFVRDALQHAIDCPFFGPRSFNGGTIPPVEGTGK